MPKTPSGPVVPIILIMHAIKPAGFPKVQGWWHCVVPFKALMHWFSGQRQTDYAYRKKMFVMAYPIRPTLVAVAACLCLFGAAGAFEESASQSTVKVAGTDHLQPFNSLIGEWKGVGQVRRGSRKGAWSEKVVCEWHFEQGAGTVVLKSEGGQSFETLNLEWDTAESRLVLRQKQQDGLVTYYGSMPEAWPDKLQLTSDTSKDGVTYRCTLQQLSPIRATIMFERRASASGSFRRLAQIGYTRVGARLAVAGANQRKCIVTGGLGTIPVSHKGKTYYVCCQGCVQAFNEAPDAIISEYKASLKK